MKYEKSLTIRIDINKYRELESLANKKETSKASLLRVALNRLLNEEY